MFLAEASIQLVPDGTLLLHLLMIGVMVFVLNRTLLKPVNRILVEREKQVEGSIEEARLLSAESEEKLRQYHTTLREARGEGDHPGRIVRQQPALHRGEGGLRAGEHCRQADVGDGQERRGARLRTSSRRWRRRMRRSGAASSWRRRRSADSTIRSRSCRSSSWCQAWTG